MDDVLKKDLEERIRANKERLTGSADLLMSLSQGDEREPVERVLYDASLGNFALLTETIALLSLYNSNFDDAELKKLESSLRKSAEDSRANLLNRYVELEGNAQRAYGKITEIKKLIREMQSLNE